MVTSVSKSSNGRPNPDRYWESETLKYSIVFKKEKVGITFEFGTEKVSVRRSDARGKQED